MILLQAAADIMLGWVAVGLSSGQLSLQALHVCETGGVECSAECGVCCWSSLLETRAQQCSLSSGQLSLRALHVCEPGGVECVAECGVWVVLLGIVARKESTTMYARTTV